MSVTLSHQSALDVIRMLRCEGVSVHDMDVIPLMAPSPWVGRRLNMRNFSSDVWRWQKPSDKRPLHILVSDKQTRVRGKGIVAHVASDDLPAGSILWLDERSSVVCPELLFLQMADRQASGKVPLGLQRKARPAESACGAAIRSRPCGECARGCACHYVWAASSGWRVRSGARAAQRARGVRRRRLLGKGQESIS